MPEAFQAEYGMPSGPGALGLARLRKFSMCHCLGSWFSSSIMGITLSFINCMALTGSIFLTSCEREFRLLPFSWRWWSCPLINWTHSWKSRGAGYDDNPEVVYIDELPNLGGASFIILTILISLWAMDLAARSTNCNCLSGESVSLLSVSLMAVLLVFLMAVLMDSIFLKGSSC